MYMILLIYFHFNLFASVRYKFNNKFNNKLLQNIIHLIIYYEYITNLLNKSTLITLI